jgi:DNA-binding SARP family transcriptional activator
MDQTPTLLQARLLGGFELRSGHGRDTAPPGRKVRALLACLVLSPGKSWPREKLMALLWSDRGEEQARASLRQALAELRRALGEPSPLRAEHDGISLDPAMFALDTVEFERLAKARRLEEAAAVYRGPLLDGHGVRDDAFDEWLGWSVAGCTISRSTCSIG